MNAKSKWIRGRLVVFFFVVFTFVVCIGSFLIQLSFIHFNVVVVIGHDDIEMWTKSSSMRATRPSDWNLKRLS